MVVFYDLKGDNSIYTLTMSTFNKPLMQEFKGDFRCIWMVPGTFDQDD